MESTLPQVTMTLNMFCRSRINPELSAYKNIDGIHNFELTSLAPLGCKVQIHEKPRNRVTYAPRSVYGWYIGQSVHNYICYSCYNIDTGGKVGGGWGTYYTIAFFLGFMTMPNYITNSYIDKHMDRYEYMKLPLDIIP